MLVTGSGRESKGLFVYCLFVLFCILIFFHRATGIASVVRQDCPLPPPGTVDVEMAMPGKVVAKEKTEWNISSPAARTLLPLFLIFAVHICPAVANL